MRHALIAALVWGLLSVASRAAEPCKPNVVFILADDLGYGDLGCYGQQKIRTPNIDGLAHEGVRLTVHYAGNNVCAPSRCVLMTGLHPGHTFVRDKVPAKGFPEGQILPPPEQRRRGQESPQLTFEGASFETICDGASPLLHPLSHGVYPCGRAHRAG